MNSTLSARFASASDSVMPGDQCEVCYGAHRPDTILLCDGCDSGWHTTCLNLSTVPAGDWFCPRCRHATVNSTCKKCRKAYNTNANPLLLCDECDKAWHLQCVGLSDVPDGDWFGPCCQQQPAKKVHPINQRVYDALYERYQDHVLNKRPQQWAYAKVLKAVADYPTALPTTIAALTRIPGIGNATARRIVDIQKTPAAEPPMEPLPRKAANAANQSILDMLLCRWEDHTLRHSTACFAYERAICVVAELRERIEDPYALTKYPGIGTGIAGHIATHMRHKSKSPITRTPKVASPELPTTAKNSLNQDVLDMLRERYNLHVANGHGQQYAYERVIRNVAAFTSVITPTNVYGIGGVGAGIAKHILNHLHAEAFKAPDDFTICCAVSEEPTAAELPTVAANTANQGVLDMLWERYNNHVANGHGQQYAYERVIRNLAVFTSAITPTNVYSIGGVGGGIAKHILGHLKVPNLLADSPLVQWESVKGMPGVERAVPVPKATESKLPTVAKNSANQGILDMLREHYNVRHGGQLRQHFAYARAIRVIADLESEVVDPYALTKFKGIGNGIAKRIADYMDNQRQKDFEQLQSASNNFKKQVDKLAAHVMPNQNVEAELPTTAVNPVNQGVLDMLRERYNDYVSKNLPQRFAYERVIRNIAAEPCKLCVGDEWRTDESFVPSASIKGVGTSIESHIQEYFRDHTSAGTYWEGNGKYQQEYDTLFKELVPPSGAANTPSGNLLAAVSRGYYRYYNDGDSWERFLAEYKIVQNGNWKISDEDREWLTSQYPMTAADWELLVDSTIERIRNRKPNTPAIIDNYQAQQ